VNDALASADPIVILSGATAVALRTISAPAAVDAVLELAPESAVVLPMTARGHLVGVLSLCRGPERVRMADHEMPMAASVVERAGLAIDNIRLYTGQRSTAQQLLEANRRLRAIAAHDRTVALALQDAMLTRLPEPDHLHLVARYLTATGTEQVGGDWYDALILPGGATTVVIGDVAGHDINAAAAMGQLRNMLRAFAWDHPEDRPSTIMSRLDRAAHELTPGTLATLVLLEVEQPPADRAIGMRELRWTNAGHPPPILLHADGTAVMLDTAHDLLIGAAPDRPRHDHTHSAPPGSTLILYTDGLIETRTADIDAGQARLLDSLRAHHRLPTGELLDAVVVEMVGSQPDDDVAILAVRFHPEDEERPAEAGPRRD
jgi:serine phosphatase RsbU (regulator of sigma subunit)